jgi:hypothetical protein
VPHLAYPDYINDNRWDVALAIASILDDIPTLPLALAGPLDQVLDVVSGLMHAVKTMRDGQDGCAHLMFRVLKFLHSLVDGLKRSNFPILDGTPTAASLFTLRRYVFSIPCPFSSAKYISFATSNLMAIRDDAIEWSRLNLLKSYIKRQN